MDKEASHSRSRAEEASTEAAGGEDLISRLPDCILGEIVTRLPTADAVRVEILSSRWRHAWCSSPLNLDLGDDGMYYGNNYHCYNRLVSGILAAHPGPCRRLRLACTSSGDDNAMRYNRWLSSPALSGLEELQIDLGHRHSSFAPDKNALPERALRFAPTLRVLRIGNHSFPSGAGAAPALRFPHLELVSFVSVEISEAALHGVLASCPVLRTLVLDSCTGFAGVRINSPTITSFAVSLSADHGCTAKPQVTLRQVIIEDAPLLEKLIPFRRWVTDETFELRVVRAPRVRALSLSTMTSKLQFGATVFKVAGRHFNLVTRDSVVREKRFLMQVVLLSTKLQTVRILALQDVDCVDDVSNFLRCFPCLEKLYLTVSEGFRSAGSYEKLNPIECIESHLKMVAINEYEGKRSHLKLAKFFVRNAWVLEQITFIRSCRSYYNPSETEEWIADQRRQLRVWNMASHQVKFHFVSDTGYRDVNNFGKHVNDLSAHIHDSSRDDPFHQWFES